MALRRRPREPMPEPHPVRQDIRNLQVITSYFNPCGYRRLRDNYWRFREALNAPLHTIELLFGDREPEISDATHVHSDTVIWHKESLLNILIERMPAEVDAIAWIDADILFENPDWVEQACRRLQDWAVVQLFAKSFHLMPDGSIKPYKQSCGKMYSERNKYWSNFAFSHPGYAWAARADWIRRHKLSDIHIIGGGDTFMMAGFTGKPLYAQTRMNADYRDAHQTWVSGVQTDVKNSLHYVPGNILHLWHGSKEDRRYIVRYEDLTMYQPKTDLIREPSGLWKWSETADPEMVAAVARHFSLRNEDAEYHPDLHNRLVGIGPNSHGRPTNLRSSSQSKGPSWCEFDSLEASPPSLQGKGHTTLP